MSTKTSNGWEATADQTLTSGDRNESGRKNILIEEQMQWHTRVAWKNVVYGTTSKTVDLRWIKGHQSFQGKNHPKGSICFINSFQTVRGLVDYV